MNTVFYSHTDCLAHDMGPGHPESPERLRAIIEQVHASALGAVLDWRDAPQATAEQLARAHDPAYVSRMLALLGELERNGDTRSLDPDTTAGPGTLRAALRAAGAAVAATDDVLSGRARNAFCAVRPPGHHATRDAAMGFCIFNNVAVAVRHALQVHGLARVAVVDFDVHHGNGTEDILAGDERVLMCSFFQHPLYPGSGSEPMGSNMLNLPLAPYSDGAAVRAVVQQHWLPALAAFAPQMIFVSAGFDAHREDPLGQLGLVEADYAWITGQLMTLAQLHAHGRIVSCLEGGYALQALARSVSAHVAVLAGHTLP
jgi:acetoin utilization deacetylase AcuC-like enzyme